MLDFPVVSRELHLTSRFLFLFDFKCQRVSEVHLSHFPSPRIRLDCGNALKVQILSKSSLPSPVHSKDHPPPPIFVSLSLVHPHHLSTSLQTLTLPTSAHTACMTQCASVMQQCQSPGPSIHSPSPRVCCCKGPCSVRKASKRE